MSDVVKSKFKGKKKGIMRRGILGESTEEQERGYIPYGSTNMGQDKISTGKTQIRPIIV